MFLFQKEENLSDVNGSTELSMHQMPSDERLKGRLVSKGFSQVEGIDYNETFAPVAKMNSIHLVLSLAALHNYEVHQMDVKSTFLHGDSHEEIYIQKPPRYVQNYSIIVYQFN